MRFSWRPEKLHISLLAALLCLGLAGCAERVDFDEKNVSAEKQEISIVLQPGETEKLDQMPELKYADLSGSECYDEILAWSKAHPEVDVLYTVAFPDGTVADNHAQSVTLGSISPDDAARTAELAGYLPALETLDITASGLSPEAASVIASALDGVDVKYSCTILGQSVGFETTELDLRGVSAELLPEAELLKYFPAVRSADLGSEQENPHDWELIAELVKACPEVDFNYSFTLYGKQFTLLDTEMDLNHINIDDGGALVYRVAACMKNLTYLDMDFCGVSNEDMAVIRDAYPNVKVVWRVWFGDNYTARTDVEKILASKPSAGGELRDRDAQILKYCTDVKYLDVGHNVLLSDMSFVAYMPDLEVAILAMDAFTDITPLENCTKLEYLELQTNDDLVDITPLGKLTNLEHLNIAHCRKISDISPLFNLTKLKRLWLGSTGPVPKEQIAALKDALPDCEFNTTVYDDPTSEGWRIDHVDPWTNQVYYNERYELLCKQFGYIEGDYSLPGNDPKYKG